jgi:integrase
MKKERILYHNVFLNRSGNVRYKRFGKAWKKACQAAKVDLKCFHDFRRTAVRIKEAPVAQWIEQWIPNPCAAGPIPAGGTNNFSTYPTID